MASHDPRAASRRGTLLRTAVSAFARAVSFIGVAVMGLMVLHITVDVVARYFFHLSLPGTIAFVSNYYMVAATFLPLVIAEQMRQHIEVEVVAQKLPEALQCALRMLAWLIAVGVFVLLGWESSHEALRAWRTQMFIVEYGVRIDTWISYFMLPVGFFAAALVAASRIVIALLHRGGFTRKVRYAAAFYGEEGKLDA
ncbi:MAG: TRAP transporter small permease [Betaproteobacteria bacterium]|nr:MAG: TRAP transporter small permease [Betaproteobacteria bacterium]